MHKPRIEVILDWLNDGPMSTRQIYDMWLDNYPKKCPTMYELANMLSRSRKIEKHKQHTNERTDHGNSTSGSRWTGHTVWRIKEERGVCY